MKTQKELTQLYKDAMFFHLVHKGHTKIYSKVVAHKMFNASGKNAMN